MGCRQANLVLTATHPQQHRDRPDQDQEIAAGPGPADEGAGRRRSRRIAGIEADLSQASRTWVRTEAADSVLAPAAGAILAWLPGCCRGARAATARPHAGRAGSSMPTMNAGPRPRSLLVGLGDHAVGSHELLDHRARRHAHRTAGGCTGSGSP